MSHHFGHPTVICRHNREARSLRFEDDVWAVLVPARGRHQYISPAQLVDHRRAVIGGPIAIGLVEALYEYARSPSVSGPYARIWIAIPSPTRDSVAFNEKIETLVTGGLSKEQNVQSIVSTVATGTASKRLGNSPASIPCRTWMIRLAGTPSFVIQPVRNSELQTTRLTPSSDLRMALSRSPKCIYSKRIDP